MTKGTKIWLWTALVLSVCTTVLNGMSGRVLSVVIALGAMAGLCVLLFLGKKLGFWVLCGCYALAFVNGVVSGLAGGAGVLATVGMSLVGSLLIPGITWLFLRKSLAQMK